jgi:hypothetical protein
MTTLPPTPGLQIRISEDPPVLLLAERLRDGRVAFGTRVQAPDGTWRAGELQFLEPAAQLDLASWLAPLVEAGWIETIRHRRTEPLRTAGELYGNGPGAVLRFALDTVAEISPALLVRAMTLLANAVGPHAHERLVSRLNETNSGAEDEELRRRLADENETFAYAVAAAALFDALDQGVYPEDL